MPYWETTVNLPAEMVYHAILNYVKAGEFSKGAKVKRLMEPTYIEVEPGDAAFGERVKIGITPQGDKSQVQLDFDFRGVAAVWLALFAFDLVALIITHDIRALIGLSFAIMILIMITGSMVGRYMDRLSKFLSFVEQTGVIPEFKKEAEEKLPADVDALYQRLTRTYSAVYGRDVRMVERKIQSYMRTGLSREEAIKKLAESEGFLEVAEEKPKPKPSLPPDTLYKRLLYKYSVYGRSIPALERKIEELTSLGLSREEAITRLAEEEGLTGRLEVAEEPSPASDIYSRLVNLYIRRSREALERKIEEYMKEGLSREEAIKKLAEKEGIT